MLKVTLTFIQLLIAIYWCGAVARQNLKVDNLLLLIEGGYTRFNSRLKDTKVKAGLGQLRSFYGWLAVVTLSFFLLLGRFLSPNTYVPVWLSLLFLGALFGWFSIKWLTQHTAMLKELAPHIALIVFAPLLLGLLDLWLGTPFTILLSDPASQLLNSFGIQAPVLSNPITIGGLLSGLMALSMLAYYLIVWVLAAPTAFLSALVVVLPIMLARLIHTYAPKKNFFGFTALVMLVVSLWMSQL